PRGDAAEAALTVRPGRVVVGERGDGAIGLGRLRQAAQVVEGGTGGLALRARRGRREPRGGGVAPGGGEPAGRVLVRVAHARTPVERVVGDRVGDALGVR